MSKTIPNAHSRADCWNPQYHADGFKRSAAAIFKRWYVKRYHGSVFHDLALFAVSPLCVFGGATISEYTREAASIGGTYAVCPSCRQVIMCGYLDDKGLSPRACRCGAKLKFNDYFQPVQLYRQPMRQTRAGMTVDPKRDPAATIAELCAYEDDGVPAYAMASWIAILHAKGLLKTGAHPDYGQFEVRTSGVESRQLDDAIRRQRWVWLDPTTRRWHVKLSDRGKSMLAARGVRLTKGAAREVERLRGLLAAEDIARLKAEAIAALGALLAR